MAHIKVVVLFGKNVTTGFGFVFGRIATERTPEVIQVGLLLCEFLKLRGYPQQKGSINKNGHNKKVERLQRI